MNKTVKRTLALMLAVLMLVSAFAACGNDSGNSSGSQDYDEISDYYYDFNLKEFREYAEQYAAETSDQNRRWALEALAEAKLMASGVMMPTTCNGALYQISAVAPGSVTTNGWGSDDIRYQYALVTDKVLKTADRDALKDLLN